MNDDNFTGITQTTISKCLKLLQCKAKEYATSDRLHNFKVAADLQGISPKQALAGMMAKHTVSVYDMCFSENQFPLGLWDEKICDSINYLLLLRALISEGENNG